MANICAEPLVETRVVIQELGLFRERIANMFLFSSLIISYNIHLHNIYRQIQALCPDHTLNFIFLYKNFHSFETSLSSEMNYFTTEHHCFITFLKLYKTIKSRFHWFCEFISSVASKYRRDLLVSEGFSFKLESTYFNANLSDNHRSEFQSKSYHCSFSLKQTQFDKFSNVQTNISGD